MPVGVELLPELAVSEVSLLARPRTHTVGQELLYPAARRTLGLLHFADIAHMRFIRHFYGRRQAEPVS